MTTITIRTALLATGLLGTTLLAGCDDPRPDPAATETPVAGEPPVISVPTASPSPTGASIIRPEVVPEPVVEVASEPVELTIGFPEGSTLTPDAQQQLATVLQSDALAEGWPIVVRGHSDSDGTSAANLATSRRRAQAVADWLMANGVDKARISVIALGAQNPVAPNAQADGTPSEAGRARNRRVEITIAAPADKALPAEPESGRGPTVAERLGRD
ncbi:OmpA family protein [Croceibacterium mercuriale]|uniref:OmpA family protein n=1 Tax=Croceibacterium mercuriale TaxID=1572751 RepID=UPI000689FE70|nr:OmpA family protein [Croceibacterium mercuriale]